MLAKKAQGEEFIANAGDLFFYKMLGGCPNCFNVWVAGFSWVLICVFADFPWWGLFPYILYSNKTIRELTGSVYDNKPVIKKLKIYTLSHAGKKF